MSALISTFKDAWEPCLEFKSASVTTQYNLLLTKQWRFPANWNMTIDLVSHQSCVTHSVVYQPTSSVVYLTLLAEHEALSKISKKHQQETTAVQIQA